MWNLHEQGFGCESCISKEAMILQIVCFNPKNHEILLILQKRALDPERQSSLPNVTQLNSTDSWLNGAFKRMERDLDISSPEYMLWITLQAEKLEPCALLMEM